MSAEQNLCDGCKRWHFKHEGCQTQGCAAPRAPEVGALVDRLDELKVTPAPWKARGMGGDSILTALSHKWHREGPQNSGFPIGVPRTFPYQSGEGTYTDFSAGYNHDDAKFMAMARNGWPLLRREVQHAAVMRAALEAIAEGCAFPEDDTQRAIRNRARAALANSTLCATCKGEGQYLFKPPQAAGVGDCPDCGGTGLAGTK